MATFEKVSDFLDFVERLRFGEISHITINFSEDEEALHDIAASEKQPLSRFAQFILSSDGLVSFETLKVQDGMPVFGVVPFQHGGRRALQNRKFN